MSQAGPRDLAQIIVNYSTAVQPGDAVMIHCRGYDTDDLAAEVQEAVLQAGGVPYIQMENERLLRRFMHACSEDIVQRLGTVLLEQMKQFQAYVGIRGSQNIFQMSDVPKEKMEWYNRHITGPVHIEQRVKHTRWCVMRYPNDSMSQLAEQPTETFQQFYYDVCCIDYAQMKERVQPLRELMEKTRQVRVVSPGTDLRFSIEGIGVVPCVGERNIPDGECFTAPHKESVEGEVQFNTPSVREGVLFENIRLRFEKGKVVEMDAGAQTDRLRDMLSVDEGARYLGEWSLGFHPRIWKPMRDTLFDEKIAGSLHMALGACYEDASNGNRSSLHWDMVLIQRPEYGGGEVWFDDTLVRKDGQFVLDELKGLNPDAW
mgnify:CR=1 FL=1